MFFLRQSTASQSVLIGPFVDSTDGNTAETALSIANTNIRLSKNGANIVSKNSGGGTHDELGYYTITLDATDTNTVGRLQLMVQMTGALPVYHEYQVLEEVLFDALFASGAARVPADATHIAGAAVSTTLAQIGVNVVNAGGVAWGSGAITAASIAADAITAAKIADNAIDAGAIATGAITSTKFAAGAIDAAAIATNAIDADALAADAIAEINATVDTALADYDGPTHAELISEIDVVQADIAALNDLSAAQVNAEVVDALAVDAYAEPGQGAPAATLSLAAKISFLFKAWRNKVEQSATEYRLYADDGTTLDQKADVSDDGTVFTRNEIATGP